MSGCDTCESKKNKIVENSIAIDKILFGDVNPKSVLEESKFKDYSDTKNALLLNLYEVYVTLGTEIKTKSYKNIAEMIGYVSTKSYKCLSESMKLIGSPRVVTVIKEEVSNITSKNPELNTKHVAETCTLKTYMRSAMDLYLFECVANDLYKIDENQDGKILMASHKIFREELINIVTEVTKVSPTV